MDLECTYQAPRATKKDQSMSVAIQAIRRLESKIEDLTAAIHTSPALPPAAKAQFLDQEPTCLTSAEPSPGSHAQMRETNHTRDNSRSIDELVRSPESAGTPAQGHVLGTEAHTIIALSFSQHRVAIWPAMKQILPVDFNTARSQLSEDYIAEIENQRAPLPMNTDRSNNTRPEFWLMDLPQAVVQGLANAYFAVFNRNMPILDKHYFYSSTLSQTVESEFAYEMESCLVLNVLALGCLAVKAHEEGDFALPSRLSLSGHGFVRPDWYELIKEEIPGLTFFNEARKRFGFLMCQNDLQAGQFYMLSTLYYAQILRPLDSWTMVNRAALCCTSLLSRVESVDFDHWEGDMLSRLFWNTLMYETVITQELDLLPRSGLLEYEAGTPLPKFMPFPRLQKMGAEQSVDEADSFFNFHFLAQAAHRIILTRIKQSLYYFAERDGFPSAKVTAEMHHQLEQWRLNLPMPLRFTDNDRADDSPSPAHVIAKAMLRSRYLVAKFHIGRPFLYKALHAPAYTSEMEYTEAAEGLRSGMHWPTTTGLCMQMQSILPLTFGWCSQCFGQVLLLHAAARSPDMRLRATLPDGWQAWVQTMMQLIERCARDSPGIARDWDLLGLL